jgi:hypothetical protein
MPHFTSAPKGGRKPINARAETVASSRMFRAAFAQRRCLVPSRLVLRIEKSGVQIFDCLSCSLA